MPVTSEGMGTSSHKQAGSGHQQHQSNTVTISSVCEVQWTSNLRPHMLRLTPRDCYPLTALGFKMVAVSPGLFLLVYCLQREMSGTLSLHLTNLFE